MKNFTNYTINIQAYCLETLKKLYYEKSNQTHIFYFTFIKKLR